MRMFEYLGWNIWRIQNETTGKTIGFEAHEPQEFIRLDGTFATLNEARKAVRNDRLFGGRR